MIKMLSILFLTLNFAHKVQAAPGDLDTSFGTNGKVITSFDDIGGNRDVASALAIQADGKIVVAGFVIGIATPNFFLARYNSDGSLNTSFGDDGRVTTEFSTGSSEEANAIVLQTDGKIVVAGESNASGGGDFALARYETSRAVDLRLPFSVLQVMTFSTAPPGATSSVV